jgi:addiction module RelE/StbE family toxin
LRLKFHGDFKKDYLKVKSMVADPAGLDKNLKAVTRILLAKDQLPAAYVTNRIIADGTGWFECFIYKDKKHNIIIQYKIEEDCLILARIGSADTLTEKRRIYLKRK